VFLLKPANGVRSAAKIGLVLAREIAARAIEANRVIAFVVLHSVVVRAANGASDLSPRFGSESRSTGCDLFVHLCGAVIATAHAVLASASSEVCGRVSDPAD
jgi:hypothetical protein